MSDYQRASKEPPTGHVSLQQSNDATELTTSTSNDDHEKQSPTLAAPEKDFDAHKAWRRVAGAWLLFFIAWGPALSYGSFQTYYRTTLLPSYSDSQLAWVGSLGTLLLTCSGALAGPLFDRGYLKHVLVIGCLLLVLSLEMLSLCTEYYQLILAQGLAYGLGSGLVYVPALAFVTTSFPPKSRPWAVGVLTSGAGFSGVLYPIMFDRLVSTVGFAWNCRIWGFISLFLACAGLLLVFDAPVKETKPRSWIDWKAFTELPFTSMCLVNFLLFLGYWIPLFFVPSYASSSLGVSFSASLYFICYISAGSIFGRIVPIPLVVKLGAFPVMVAASGATAIILFCWIAVKSYAGFVVWCLAIGFTSGMFISVNPVIFALPIISPPEIVGTRFGIAWLAAALGALVGTPIAGALADPETGMFLHAQIFAGCIILGATAVLLVPWSIYARKSRSGTIS